MSALLGVMALWRGRAGWLLAGAVVSLAALAAGIGLAVASGAAVAAALAGGGLAATGLLRGLGPGRVVLRYAERLVTHDATFRALSDLRVWFFRRLAAGAGGGIGFARTGDLLSRLVADVEALDGLYLRILLPLAGAVLLLPVLVWALWPLGAGLALAMAALFVVTAFALPLQAARMARGSGGEVARHAAGLRVAVLDALRGLREVRAFGLEGRMLAGVQASEAALLAAQHRQARGLAWTGAAALLCGQAGLAILLLRVGEGGAGVRGIVAVFLAVSAFEAVAGLSRAGWLAGQAAAAAARIVGTATPALPRATQATATGIGDSLKFEAVRFGWSPERATVFDGLTLDVPQGGRVALLGPSGVGKSSLAALALRIASPQSGRILLGGVDIADLPLGELRERVGLLNQATHLFQDTIRANLALADPTADEGAMWAALDAAQIGDLVRALPDGLDAWVGEAGSLFSGGEGRRLALARVLLSPARVLILDEPCAGLDAVTERAFFATLNAVADGRSIVLIAHRLTGAERLDRVWRLSGGRAVAAAA